MRTAAPPRWPGHAGAQREREAADNLPFEEFRKQYLAQDLMGGEHFRMTC